MDTPKRMIERREREREREILHAASIRQRAESNPAKTREIITGRWRDKKPVQESKITAPLRDGRMTQKLLHKSMT